MKKIIIILASILVALVLFLFVVYMVAVKTTQSGESTPGETFSLNDTFKNPSTIQSPTIKGTTTITTGTVFVNGSTTISTTTENLPTIPASIVFENAANNNDNIVLSVDSVGESADGTVVVAFRLVTTNALQPTTIDPGKIIKITTAEGNETEAKIIEGNFSNITPGQILSGQVVFFLSQKRDKIILQVGQEERMMFYEFDFTKKTYKQADIS